MYCKNTGGLIAVFLASCFLLSGCCKQNIVSHTDLSIKHGRQKLLWNHESGQVSNITFISDDNKEVSISEHIITFYNRGGPFSVVVKKVSGDERKIVNGRYYSLNGKVICDIANGIGESVDVDLNSGKILAVTQILNGMPHGFYLKYNSMGFVNHFRSVKVGVLHGYNVHLSDNGENVKSIDYYDEANKMPIFQATYDGGVENVIVGRNVRPGIFFDGILGKVFDPRTESVVDANLKVSPDFTLIVTLLNK